MLSVLVSSLPFYAVPGEFTCCSMEVSDACSCCCPKLVVAQDAFAILLQFRKGDPLESKNRMFNHSRWYYSWNNKVC